MPPFYPCTSSTTRLCLSSLDPPSTPTYTYPSVFTTVSTTVIATATSTPTKPISGEPGTALSVAAIIGIVVAIMSLFASLGAFIHCIHQNLELQREDIEGRKKRANDRNRRREEVEEEARIEERERVQGRNTETGSSDLRT